MSDAQKDRRPSRDDLLVALTAATEALAPIADRCDEAVRPDDTDRDGVTVKTILLRQARQAHRECVAVLASEGFARASGGSVTIPGWKPVWDDASSKAETSADTETALEAFVNWMDGRQRAIVLAAGTEFAQFEKPMGLLAVNGCVNALRVLEHRVDDANNHSYRLTTLGILAKAMLTQMDDAPEYQPPWDGSLPVFRIPPKAPPQDELEALAEGMGLLPRDAEADEETPAPGAAR